MKYPLSTKIINITSKTRQVNVVDADGQSVCIITTGIHEEDVAQGKEIADALNSVARLRSRVEHLERIEEAAKAIAYSYTIPDNDGEEKMDALRAALAGKE